MRLRCPCRVYYCGVSVAVMLVTAVSLSADTRICCPPHLSPLAVVTLDISTTVKVLEVLTPYAPILYLYPGLRALRPRNDVGGRGVHANDGLDLPSLRNVPPSDRVPPRRMRYSQGEGVAAVLAAGNQHASHSLSLSFSLPLFPSSALPLFVSSSFSLAISMRLTLILSIYISWSGIRF